MCSRPDTSVPWAVARSARDAASPMKGSRAISARRRRRASAPADAGRWWPRCAGSWPSAGASACAGCSDGRIDGRERTERGISKQGEPSRPTPSRTGPADRDHDLGGQQAVVAGPAARGVGDPVAKEVPRRRSRAGTTRNELLENSAFMIDSPSETMVPVPTVAERGHLVLDFHAEVGAGLLHRRQPVADQAQVAHDGRAVAEQAGEERRCSSSGTPRAAARSGTRTAGRPGPVSARGRAGAGRCRRRRARRPGRRRTRSR